MLNLAFASPWLLGFLGVLPALWWLLRLMPPAPKKIIFPAIALLYGLVGREQTPARSPWWLLLLRLCIAALIILAFAEPVFNPLPVATGQGALLLAIDNDWAAARDWQARQNNARAIIRDAARAKRAIYILATTPAAANNELALAGPMAAEDALATVDALTPEPWGADWEAAAALLQKPPGVISESIWISSGIGSVAAKNFYARLQGVAATKVFATSTPLYTLLPPVSEGDRLSIAVMRAATDTAAAVTVNGVAKDGAIVTHWEANFTAGAPHATVQLDLPSDLRNRIARFEVEEPRTAASVALLDAAWEHCAVGIAGEAAELDRHSLLSEIYYIDRALKPFADLHIAPLDVLLKEKLPVIILTDATPVNETLLPTLSAWIKSGGVLVRFSGEAFAASQHTDDRAIIPVPLRSGGRSLGGALTWGAPQKLQSFPANSPFFRLAIPDDVTVSRQILAEPTPDLTAKTWAALADGTPLVTASPIGQGISILFHVPAKMSWSNLPISGLFVDMLQKIVQLSRGTRAAAAANSLSLPPLSVLDASGNEHLPAATALPLKADVPTIIAPQHPPGLYGTDADNVALNLGTAIGQPEALQGVPVEIYNAAPHDVTFKPILLAAAFLLLLGDFLISLSMRGFLKIACLAVCLLLTTHTAMAANNDDAMAVELSSKTYLAFVATGDAATDHISEVGLRSLAAAIQNRTSINEMGVAKVDPNSDDLAFFPLLYWPVIPDAHPLTATGARRVTHYLQHGGMILFDAAGGGEDAPVFLQHALRGVDLPPLTRIPDNHVLKRSFYLLRDVPGRFAGHDFWLEPEDASATDGVASVLYGSNGWAEAWAMDASGRPMFPCTPNGEAQRETAFRFGVNLVTYALTGNYKNDQLQTSALLEKIGK